MTGDVFESLAGDDLDNLTDDLTGVVSDEMFLAGPGEDWFIVVINGSSSGLVVLQPMILRNIIIVTTRATTAAISCCFVISNGTVSLTTFKRT